MAKLQSIKRTNGSVVFSVNIPLELIELREWEKGDDLEISDINDANLYLGIKGIVIIKN